MSLDRGFEQRARIKPRHLDRSESCDPDPSSSRRGSMSTAGKVLSVLVVLVMTVWIVMMSAVTQLNTDASKRLADLQDEILKLKEEVGRTERNAFETRLKINDEQVGKERDMTLVRTRLSTAERQLSTTRESLSRVQIQVENYTKALETAKAGLALRNEEKARVEKDKAEEEAVVKRLQGENSELTERLLKLRTDFQTTLKQNQAEVQKQLKGGRALTRSASFIR